MPGPAVAASRAYFGRSCAPGRGCAPSPVDSRPHAGDGSVLSWTDHLGGCHLVCSLGTGWTGSRAPHDQRSWSRSPSSWQVLWLPQLYRTYPLDL